MSQIENMETQEYENY